MDCRQRILLYYFKVALGTDMAIFAVKQTVYFYRGLDPTVYTCLLDAQEAVVSESVDIGKEAVRERYSLNIASETVNLIV